MRFSKTHIIVLTAMWTALLLPSFATAQAIWYVDDDGKREGDCTSWADACPELQTALSVAQAGDQIWVAVGTYQPDYDVATATHTRDRSATFQLINGVELYGGLSGAENELAARADWFGRTVLSGDLGGNDGREFAGNEENSYHVVTGSGTDQLTVLDGFTIKGGNADGEFEEDQFGAGMYNEFAGPTITNCTFQDNSAGFVIEPTSSCCFEHDTPGCDDPKCEEDICSFTDCCSDPWGPECVEFAQSCGVCQPQQFGQGGGMYNSDGDPNLTDCTFVHNRSKFFGGGMYNTNSNPTLSSCSFTNNHASAHGGGLYNQNSDSVVTDTTFADNHAGLDGGGAHNIGSSPQFSRCIFERNHAGRNGGGVENTDEQPIFEACSFEMNSASKKGGGMSNSFSFANVLACKFIRNDADRGGGLATFASSTAVRDCIFEGNEAEHGGGMHVNGVDTVRRTLFRRNVAKDSGGGVDIFKDAKFFGCWFIENSAIDIGGAINTFAGDPTIANCVITANTASNSAGMAFVSSEPKITNCTIIGNTATEGSVGGMIIGHNNSTAAIENCILWGNTGVEGGGILAQILISQNADVNVDYNCIEGLTNEPLGVGNIGDDPLLVDAENGDYHLQKGSPCIDTGDPEFVPAPGETDLDGQPRVQNCRVDMGSDESPFFVDCNDNDSPDACEPVKGITPDCNDNDSPDDCDIADGTSPDDNGDGIPDECETCSSHLECDDADPCTTDTCNVDSCEFPDRLYGDANNDGARNIIDVICSARVIFQAATVCGSHDVSLDEIDIAPSAVCGDGLLNIVDVVAHARAVFQNAPDECCN